MPLPFTTGIHECRSGGADTGDDIVARGVRNGESQRCILTSGAAHHNPENITHRDLQFGWLWPTVFHVLPFFLAPLVSPHRLPTTGSLLLSMKCKHRHEIRPGHSDAENPESRLTRNKNAVNFHFPPRTSHCVIVCYTAVLVQSSCSLAGETFRIRARSSFKKERSPVRREDKLPKSELAPSR